MFAQQLGQGPAFWQHRRVPDFQMVVIHPNLHRCAYRIVAMHQRIEQRLAQRRLRYRKGLNALNSLVRHHRLEIFGEQ